MVYVLSYEAPVSNWLGTAMPLQDRAVNVLESLLGEPSLRNHPIIFICHSLGGLIIKQLLLDLHQQKGRRAEAAVLLDQVKQVVFIATPHTGSHSATLLYRLRFLAWPSSVARTLVANDPTLRAINVSYRGLAEERKHKLSHRVFCETWGTPAGIIVDRACPAVRQYQSMRIISRLPNQSIVQRFCMSARATSYPSIESHKGHMAFLQRLTFRLSRPSSPGTSSPNCSGLPLSS